MDDDRSDDVDRPRGEEAKDSERSKEEEGMK